MTDDVMFRRKCVAPGWHVTAGAVVETELENVDGSDVTVLARADEIYYNGM
jgi:hypothetical protein